MQHDAQSSSEQRADRALWMVGCLRVGALTIPHPISERDIAADADFATRLFASAGVKRGDVVLITSGSSEYGQFWPYEVSLESMGACLAIAENLPFDASRSEMFLRRLPVAAAFGIGMPVLDGMHGMGISLEKAFTATPIVFARDAAADRLRAAGIAAWRLLNLGPAFAFQKPDGEVIYDRDEWLLEADDGWLTISSLKLRANPLVRFRSPVRGTVTSQQRTVSVA